MVEVFRVSSYHIKRDSFENFNDATNVPVLSRSDRREPSIIVTGSCPEPQTQEPKVYLEFLFNWGYKLAISVARRADVDAEPSY